MPEEFPKNDGILTAEQRVDRICEIWNDDFISEFMNLRRQSSMSTGDFKTTVSVAADYAPGIGDVTIDVDATLAARTITFAPNPVDGQTHVVCKNDASGNAVTVDGGDYNINGAATSSIGTQYLCKIYRFIGGANEWRIISNS